MNGIVESVQRSPGYTMSKPAVPGIRLLEGLGVEGDVHAGVTVKHRSRIARDPDQPNQRQVHLIHAELHERLQGQGFDVGPGRMGENVTTRGLDLLALPTGTLLRLGREAVVQLTGLRTPCGQLNGLQKGLQGAVLDHDDNGELMRLCGVMGIVLASGDVLPGDPITVVLPPAPHEPMAPV